MQLVLGRNMCESVTDQETGIPVAVYRNECLSVSSLQQLRLTRTWPSHCWPDTGWEVIRCPIKQSILSQNYIFLKGGGEREGHWGRDGKFSLQTSNCPSFTHGTQDTASGLSMSQPIGLFSSVLSTLMRSSHPGSGYLQPYLERFWL